MKRFDVLLILALLGASFFAGLQAWELRKGNKVGVNKVVGKVSSLKGEAFRKGDADFFYVPAANGVSVAENDQLTTGVQSEAQIQLQDQQSKIILKEMSHIILKFQKDSFILDIRSGDIEAILAPGEVILVDGGKTLSAQGGLARVRYNKGLEGSTFKVLEGRVVVADGAKNSVVTPAGSADGLAQIQMQSPEDGAKVVSLSKEVSFLWSASQDLGPYTVKVFLKDRLIQSQDFKENKGLLKLPENGTYTWTLQATKAKENVLPNYSFTLFDQALITLESPVTGKVFTLAADKPEQDVEFKWKQQLLEETSLVLEKIISASEHQPFASEKNPAQAEVALAKKIPAGEFRWRVEIGKVVSGWNVFQIKKEEIKIAKPTPTPKPVVKNVPKSVPTPPPPAPLPAPKVAATPTIVEPVVEKNNAPEEQKKSWNGIEIPKIVSPDSGSNIITKADVITVDVQAKSVTCSDYEIEIDTAKNFSNPTILKSESGKGRAALKAAAYFIRARCWKDGDMGEWSLVRDFRIQKN